MIKTNILTKNNKNFHIDNYKSFIEKNDFNKIMSLFSRMLLANNWKDYSFSKEKDRVIFCFYRHSYENPICKIIYQKKSSSFKHWITTYSDNKSRTSNSLEKIIHWIESKYPKII